MHWLASVKEYPVENVPATHDAQVLRLVSPNEVENVPGPHDRQNANADDAMLDEYDPAGQLVHVGPVLGLYVPAGQLVHVWPLPW